MSYPSFGLGEPGIGAEGSSGFRSSPWETRTDPEEPLHVRCAVALSRGVRGAGSREFRASFYVSCDPREVEAGDLERLAAVGSESVIAAGQTLVERDHPGAGLYFVVEGRVIVEAPEGRRDLGPGALLGERSLLSPDGVRTARVRAATEVRVLTVDRIKFEALCADDPGLAERLRSQGSPA